MIKTLKEPRGSFFIFQKIALEIKLMKGK